MISDEELARVKALAEAATPGPWAFNNQPNRVSNAYDQIVFPVLRAREIVAWAASREKNAAFIAAANPEFVLRLIARIEELERSLVRGPRGVLDL